MKKELFNKIKSKLNVVLLVGVTILVLYFSMKDDFDTIVNQLINVNLVWLFYAILALVSTWVLKMFVMRSLVRNFKPKYKLKKASTIVLSTQFFNAITPFSSGGQPFQIYTLNKQGLKLSQASNVTIQYSIITQIALVIVSSIAVVLNNFYLFIPNDNVLKNLTLLGYTINLLVILGLFILAFGKTINKWLIEVIINILKKLKLVKNMEKTLEFWNNNLSEFHEGAKLLLENKLKFIKNILLCTISLTIFYSIPYFLGIAIGIEKLGIIVTFVTTAYVMLIGSFVPIPGGTGGIEFGFVRFFGYAISGAVLSSLLILWRFITYYFAMIVGAIALNIQRRD